MKIKWPKRGVKMKEGQFAGTTVFCAPQDEIEPYYSRIQDMLRDCLGHGAMITDLSSWSDFSPSAEEMAKVRTLYDINAQSGDTLLTTAKRIWK